MSFAKKEIDVSFSMQNGQFAGGGNTASFSGLRVTAKIHIPGGKTPARAEVAIYGLPMAMMNQLSLIGKQASAVGKNTISLSAGDEGQTHPKIFQGTITKAWVDAKAMPEVAFRVAAVGGQLLAVQPAKPTSVKGSTQVAGLFKTLAQKMGVTFENNGVSGVLNNPYLHGSLWTQAQQLATAAGCEMYLENEQTLAIWKSGGSRKGSALKIAPGQGLVGYPDFNSAAVVVTTEYNPSTKYGGQMSITSALTPACGTWNINNVDLDIESQVPRGKWFAILTGVSAGQQDASDQ